MPAAPADSPHALLNSLAVMLRTTETCHDRLVALAAMLPGRQQAGTDGKEDNLGLSVSRQIARLKLEFHAAVRRFGAIAAAAKARAKAVAMEGKKENTTRRDDGQSTSSLSIRTSDALPAPTEIDLCRMIDSRLEVSRRLLERLAGDAPTPTLTPSVPKGSPTSQVLSIQLRLEDGKRRTPGGRQSRKQGSMAPTSTIGAQRRNVIVFRRAIGAVPHIHMAKPNRRW